MSFTRKMFRILTCLLKKGLFSILVQNSPKVTKKVLVFCKVARSCSLTKKLLKILKVAKKLPSRIRKGLHPLFCKLMKQHESMKDLLPQNPFLYFWPLPVKYITLTEDSVLPLLLSMNYYLFDLTVWVAMIRLDSQL